MLLYTVACLIACLAYMNVGHVIWNGVRANLEENIDTLSMLEQERQGNMAMLLPKFTVIVFWPVIAAFGVAANVVSALRAQVAPTA